MKKLNITIVFRKNEEHTLKVKPEGNEDNHVLNYLNFLVTAEAYEQAWSRAENGTSGFIHFQILDKTTYQEAEKFSVRLDAIAYITADLLEEDND